MTQSLYLFKSLPITAATQPEPTTTASYLYILNIDPQTSIKIPNSATSIEQALLKYQALLDYQPTHRDLLLNTAILYYEQGNIEQYHEYLAKAKNIDPNNELFTKPNTAASVKK